MRLTVWKLPGNAGSITCRSSRFRRTYPPSSPSSGANWSQSRGEIREGKKEEGKREKGEREEKGERKGEKRRRTKGKGKGRLLKEDRRHEKRKTYEELSSKTAYVHITCFSFSFL